MGRNDKYNDTFLDYRIRNSGNGDGYVLFKDRAYEQHSWECHLGNYGSLEDAQVGALKQFMIARPGDFNFELSQMLNGDEANLAFVRFSKVVEKSGLSMPSAITRAEGLNGGAVLIHGKSLRRRLYDRILKHDADEDERVASTARMGASTEKYLPQ